MAILSRTNARRLDQRIKVMKPHEVRTNSGAVLRTELLLFVELWACVDAVKANERYNAEQELAGNEYTVWVRWRGDLSTKMIILWNGLTLDIKGIPDNQKRGRFMTLFCESGITPG